MEPLRKPFQGIWNIVRLNWHFYLLSIVLVLSISLLNGFFNNPYHRLINIITLLIVAVMTVSLAVSFYVYDLSNLYSFNWLNELSIQPNHKIVNVNAGFDETSALFQHRFPGAELIIFDFYDPIKHTEVSIKRARKAYPPFQNTIKVSPSALPLQNEYAHDIFVIFSAHEIRKEDERNAFFDELNRILISSGKIVVMEHLRDIPNFFAYTIGAFHFFAKSSWYRTFKSAGLAIYEEMKVTPFVTVFILEKNGTKS